MAQQINLKHFWIWLIITLLFLVPINGLAENLLFGFIDAHEVQMSQIGLTDSEKDALVQTDVEWSLEMEHASYHLEELAYDGCTLHMLIRATPNHPETEFLESAYRSPFEAQPGQESPAERAKRENMQIVQVGFYAETENGQISGDSMLSARADEDGSMLLYMKHIAYDSSEGEQTVYFRIREQVFGEETDTNQIENIMITPNVPLTIQKSECHFDVLCGEITSLTLYRSPLGMCSVVQGQIKDCPDASTKSALDNTYAILLDKDGCEFYTDFGNMSIQAADGRNVFSEEIEGGETYWSRSLLAANEQMPEQVIIRIGNIEYTVIFD